MNEMYNRQLLIFPLQISLLFYFSMNITKKSVVSFGTFRSAWRQRRKVVKVVGGRVGVRGGIGVGLAVVGKPIHRLWIRYSSFIFIDCGFCLFSVINDVDLTTHRKDQLLI